MKFFRSSTRPEGPGPATPRTELAPQRERPQPADPPVAQAPRPGGSKNGGGGASVIGATVFVRGEVIAKGNLEIEGRVEGSVLALEHQLVISESARVEANLEARQVIVHGHVQGNIKAGERIEIAPSGRLMGDICSPRVTLSDGSSFTGSINREGAPAVMERSRPDVNANATGAAPSSTQPRNEAASADRRGKDRPWSQHQDGSGRSSPTNPA